MECGLQWKDITCWDDVPRLTLTHEENLETAIADYCPDMGRVVETCGQLCLRSVTAQGGGVELQGTVRVTVLYTSEESPAESDAERAVHLWSGEPPTGGLPSAVGHGQTAAVRGAGTDAPASGAAHHAGMDGVRL